MFYEGNDIEELLALIPFEEEPIVIVNSILSADDVIDMERFYGWIFEPKWYRTEIISWGPGAVSSRTTQHQRLIPPVGWLPETVPAPEPEPEVPVEDEPALEVPPDEEPTPDVPPEGDTDEHTS